jgi:hypothetical protein
MCAKPIMTEVVEFIALLEYWSEGPMPGEHRFINVLGIFEQHPSFILDKSYFMILFSLMTKREINQYA